MGNLLNFQRWLPAFKGRDNPSDNLHFRSGNLPLLATYGQIGLMSNAIGANFAEPFYHGKTPIFFSRNHDALGNQIVRFAIFINVIHVN